MANCDGWLNDQDEKRREWEKERDRICAKKDWQCDKWEQKWQCDKWAKQCRWITFWNCILDWVCTAGKRVTTGLCETVQWVDTAACKAFTKVGVAAGWTGTRLVWVGCKAYDEVIEPLINWVFAAVGCRPDWSAESITRLTPKPDHELSEKARAYKNGKRLILCTDGGGVRGIITLRALRALEEELNVRCIDLFDMFAGTSTGAIIAGALAWGVSVDDLVKIYRKKHSVIFTKTVRASLIPVAGVAIASYLLFGPGVAIGLGLLVGLAGPQILIPRYNNKPLKCILKSIFHDDTLAGCRRDVFITAKDTVRSETTYFTAFHGPGGAADIRGTYQDVRLREAIVASAGSAPIFFEPVGRFIDGGVGSYNNVSYVAAVEAMRFSGRPNTPGDSTYTPGAVNVVSFGTGMEINNLAPGEAKGRSVALSWIADIVGEGFQDASEQQSYVADEELRYWERAIEFRRFDLYFSDEGLAQLRPFNNKIPAHMPSDDLQLDSIGSFKNLDRIGGALGEFLRQRPGTRPRFEHHGILMIGFPPEVRPDLAIGVYAPQTVKPELRSENP